MAEPAAIAWADVSAAGGIREWVDAQIAKQGLADPGASQSMSDAEKKLYKARREEERRVRRELFKQAWAAYKRSHIVHLGPGVWWHAVRCCWMSATRIDSERRICLPR